jgi:hypothetical protein
MTTCLALTRKKERCKNPAIYSGYCGIHKKPVTQQVYTPSYKPVTQQVYTPSYKPVTQQVYTPSYKPVTTKIDNITRPVTGNFNHAFNLLNFSKLTF